MHFSKAFRNWWDDDIVLTLGRDEFTRRDCVQIFQVASLNAIRNLQRALDALRIRSAAQLRRTPWWQLQEIEEGGVGERSVFVASHIIRANFGDQALDEWIARTRVREERKAKNKTNGKVSTTTTTSAEVRAEAADKATTPK